MILEFKLPPIGEGVDSADIAEILINPGDTLTGDSVVMELETEKAVIELTCPHEGAVRELSVSTGDTITVGQTLFTIEVSEAAAGGDGAQDNDSSAGKEASAEKKEESAKSEEKSEASQKKTASAEEQSPEETEDESESEEAGEAREVEFVLPNIGEGVETAEIAEIHVSEGDEVAKNEIVMDLETEKAVVELPCDHAGKITSVHVSAGDTVEVGQKLLTLQSTEAATKSASKKSTSEKPAKRQEAKAPEKPAKEQAESKSAAPAKTETKQQKSTAVVRRTELVTSEGNGQAPVPAAPSTRRLARQLGVDLRNVSGSGPGGRITQEDVQDFVRQSLQQQLPAVADRGGVPALIAGSLAPPPLPDFSKYGLVEREKLSKIGRTAAENLSVSWNVIPHVTQHDRADVTELEAARKKFAKGAGADAPKVTMTAIVMKALAACLQEYPKFNSSLDPETSEIVYKRYFHLGCAVDTPSGLLVPVIRDCDEKSIREIAAELAELAALARDRKLPIDAMQGATCTVTNLGGIGGTSFTPIVNYPEVCILGMSRGQKDLQLVNGDVSERMLLPLSLSYDHRVINGADAARFMVTLCNMLSDPFQLLSAI